GGGARGRAAGRGGAGGAGAAGGDAGGVGEAGRPADADPDRGGWDPGGARAVLTGRGQGRRLRALEPRARCRGQVNVPNFLTGLRLAAVPVFVVLLLEGMPGAALAVFVGAMITDWLDGIAARVLKQFTPLGAILDPIADKLLGVSALVLLCLTGRLPIWMLWLV